ncbi:helix-turn-helix transcriptional regulator [Mucilaginibacter ginkgonis]|uniref:Helix-turn-helix transcriptional regulator n=1 Tax=Mucilaginibacter ginkgonis TaxID=2682091 RepID=A0A6I4HUG9_9SPHI|nr:helix-turn-helix transcriptional regulator [Mucilaginibacter ginkgonis]QQL50166.1 helix-turn-helix transcriptional regulator [Mucilaginibacter ginkgonis]
MDNWIEKYWGIAPAAILDRTLKLRKVKQATFARQVEMPVQTLNAFLKGKRKLTPEAAFKIDNALGLEESTMSVLQAIYETKLVKKDIVSFNRPDMSKIRPVLFWDTDIQKIDWKAHQGGVIKRVLERGNQDEKNEIQRFYGKKAVQDIDRKMKTLNSDRTAYKPNP